MFRTRSHQQGLVVTVESFGVFLFFEIFISLIPQLDGLDRILDKSLCIFSLYQSFQLLRTALVKVNHTVCLTEDLVVVFALNISALYCWFYESLDGVENVRERLCFLPRVHH